MKNCCSSWFGSLEFGFQTPLKRHFLNTGIQQNTVYVHVNFDEKIVMIWIPSSGNHLHHLFPLSAVSLAALLDRLGLPYKKLQQPLLLSLFDPMIHQSATVSVHAFLFKSQIISLTLYIFHLAFVYLCSLFPLSMSVCMNYSFPLIIVSMKCWLQNEYICL